MPNPYTLLSQTITIATGPNITTPDVLDLAAQRGVLLVGNFTYGSGGTSVDAYIQTSTDGGNTWYDVACFQFTTASDLVAFNLSARTPVTSQATPASQSMTANTCADGLLGDRLRVVWSSVGTYSGGTTLQITAVAR
jgi:hypothetical protein